MTLDLEMAEIAKVFFQESREGLDAMEAGFLTLGATADSESINTIFRAAHSIKGGAATFGFAAVADFTHGVETLLDEMRNGVRPVTAEAVQTLLQACDCLREMVAATEAEQPLDQGRIASLNLDITNILGERPHAAPAAPAISAAPAVPAAPSVRAAPAAPEAPAATNGAVEAGWRINFEPVADLLRLRNEPTRMFAELKRLGDFAARADVSRIPLLDALDPESCYLSWKIEVAGQIPRAEIDESIRLGGLRMPARDRYRRESPRQSQPAPAAAGRKPRRLRNARPTHSSRAAAKAEPAAGVAPLAAAPQNARAVNRTRSAWRPRRSTTSSIWSASCSSRNRCSAALPTASIRTISIGCARDCRNWHAIRASCRRA